MRYLQTAAWLLLALTVLVGCATPTPEVTPTAPFEVPLIEDMTQLLPRGGYFLTETDHVIRLDEYGELHVDTGCEREDLQGGSVRISCGDFHIIAIPQGEAYLLTFSR
jgi:hypothetical protein